ncbi:MAG TPA: hypothetical protein VGK59_08475 [Ohtaekwangia sp.]
MDVITIVVTFAGCYALFMFLAYKLAKIFFHRENDMGIKNEKRPL